MKQSDDKDGLSGEELVQVLSALASPHRLRILALLAEGRQYVSQLAREVRLSRPLVHMHLKRLQAAGLVLSNLELSEEGKAMRYFEIAPFKLELTPEVISAAAGSLPEVGADSPPETMGALRPDAPPDALDAPPDDASEGR